VYPSLVLSTPTTLSSLVCRASNQAQKQKEQIGRYLGSDFTYMRHEQGAIISFASEVAGEEEDEPHNTPPRALTALQRVHCYVFIVVTIPATI
jgi:hypothetical protein